MVAFIRKLLALCRPYRRRLVLGIVMGLLGGLMEPALMLCVKFAVDVIFPGASAVSTSFSPGDIKDLPAFSRRLSHQSDEVSKFLWVNFSTNTQQRLADYATRGETYATENLKQLTTMELNRIIINTNVDVYDENRFAGVNLSTLVQQMFYEAHADQIPRMNQLLIAQAYPTELKVKLSWLEKHLRTRREALKFYRAFSESSFASHRANVVLVILAIPVIMLLRGLVSYLNVYYLQWVSVRAITDLRTKLFAHLIKMPLGFLHRTSTGELLSRISSDTASVQNAISNSLVTLIKDPATLIGLIILLLWNEPFLTMLSLIVFPLCLVPIVFYARKVRQASGAIQNEYAELYRIMHEAFTGNRIVKAYNLENTVIGQFKNASAKFISHYMRATRAGEIPGPLIEFFGAIGVACLFYYMLIVTNRELDAGAFLMFVLSIFSMYRPIKSLSRLYNTVQQADAASERVFELLDTPSDLVEPANPRPLKAAGMDIQFDHIDFNYGEKPVLRDFNLTVKAGQLVALVGRTGSGKTTATSLLLRFYDPQKGAVRIGGTDIREVASNDLRNQIAVVTQDTLLFDDTVRRNIELGRPGATEAEIIAAAKHAHAHEFIADKDRGYDTMIGEKGVMLSGGQKQRLAIARAILKNAPILILDEATNSLDPQTERAVQRDFDELMQNRTTLCIAHRLSTIEKADVIVVLHEGRIVEMGKHDELMAQNGVYRAQHDRDLKSPPPEEEK